MMVMPTKAEHHQAHLEGQIDHVLDQLAQLRKAPPKFSDAESLMAYELAIHQMLRKLGDCMVASKIQQHNNQDSSADEDREYVHHMSPKK